MIETIKAGETRCLVDLCMVHPPASIDDRLKIAAGQTLQDGHDGWSGCARRDRFAAA
jgi:hypothetical protein